MLLARSRLIAILTIAILAIAGAVFVFVRGGDDATRTTATLTQPDPTSTPEVTASPEPAKALSVQDLGTVKGVEVIWGPKVEDGTQVKFVLNGPQRYAKLLKAEPYRIRVDTTKLRNGDYKLTVATITDGETEVTKRGKLTIANVKPSKSATPKPSASASRKPTPTPTRSTGGNSSFAGQVISLTNAERKKAGCGALKSQATLAKVAQAHSVDMAKQDYFSHNSKNGKTPFQRMTDAGYAYSAAAENIAAGQRTPKDVVAGWMNSTGHRANILNCNLTQIGVGYATGGSYGTYWTQDFGRP